jgi:hypothetical protein
MIKVHTYTIYKLKYLIQKSKEKFFLKKDWIVFNIFSEKDKNIHIYLNKTVSHQNSLYCL